MPKLEPKIAISVPIGAWSPLFRSCLNSILNQDAAYSLAILDASGDPRIAADIKALGIKPDYHRTGKDGGQTAAINEGWANIEGDILAWLNTDDILYGGALTQVAAHFKQHPELDVYYGNSTISDTQGRIIGLHPEVEAPTRLLFRSNIISQPSCFFRRKAVDAVGGMNAKLHYTMDWDLWVRLMEAGRSFEHTADIFSNVTWGFDTKTSRFNGRRVRELLAIVRRNHGAYTVSKTLFGFMQHYLKTYFRPIKSSSPRKSDSRQSSGSVKSLNTPIQSGLTLPLINVSGAQASRIIIDIATTTPISGILNGKALIFNDGETTIPCKTANLSDAKLEFKTAPHGAVFRQARFY